jgi:DmsE family decaheme c-type cytochrome
MALFGSLRTIVSRRRRASALPAVASRKQTILAYALSAVMIAPLPGTLPASAAVTAPPSQPFSEFRNFVMSASSPSESQTVSAQTTKQSARSEDPSFTALSEFTQRLKVGSDSPRKVQVAEATNAFDAMREYLQGAPPPPPPSPAPAPAAAVPVTKGPVVAATYVGSKACAGCHVPYIEAFKKTTMGKLFVQGKLDCETCHGPASAHVKAGGGRGVGGIISFRVEDLSRSSKENNAICLGCHERGDRTYWSGSIHEVRDLSCSNCHTVMKNVSIRFNLKTAFEPDTCFQCHKDRQAQMYRQAHHPTREGKIICTDCHNPHGSVTEALLKTDTINDTCYKCHAEKRGPFLFEHLPVRENCLNCHDPHGTNNEFMLKISRPRLCAECHGVGHGLGSGFNAVQTVGRSCQNCHTEVHGTNSPSGPLHHR